MNTFEATRPAPRCVHRVERHFPGPGSVAMAWVIRKSVESLVRGIRWRGRCGALHLYHKPNAVSPGVNLCLTGVYAAHGDLLCESLADASWLIRQRPFGSPVIMLGDWNVDILSSLQIDPWFQIRTEAQVQADDRRRLNSFLDAMRLRLVFPAEVASPSGGPFAWQTAAAPVSRLPVGEQAQAALPSTLDYAAEREPVIKRAVLHWRGVLADHAMLQLSCAPVFAHLRPRKTSWICRDATECRAWMRANAPTAFADETDIHSFLARVQHEWADRRTCAQRRFERIPSQV